MEYHWATGALVIFALVSLMVLACLYCQQPAYAREGCTLPKVLLAGGMLICVAILYYKLGVPTDSYTMAHLPTEQDLQQHAHLWGFPEANDVAQWSFSIRVAAVVFVSCSCLLVVACIYRAVRGLSLIHI